MSNIWAHLVQTRIRFNSWTSFLWIPHILSRQGDCSNVLTDRHWHPQSVKEVGLFGFKTVGSLLNSLFSFLMPTVFSLVLFTALCGLNNLTYTNIWRGSAFKLLTCAVLFILYIVFFYSGGGGDIINNNDLIPKMHCCMNNSSEQHFLRLLKHKSKNL